ncbi:MAG: glycoside hydrolase family 32 protein [Acidobacteriota bacterium]
METTRRRFVIGLAAVTATPCSLLARASVGSSLESRLAADPMRPQFHLLPPRNWMNDPNGPIYFEGHYHMFFQYNPEAAVWGDMSWGHAISQDMLHWRHLPVALTPSPGGPDSFGCFSGSAIAVGPRVYAVYTGTQKSSDALATIRDGANNIQESQCLAWSDDPQLKRWEKDPQPIVARPPAGMRITGFRDPSVWRQGDWYYMTVGSGVESVGGCVLLYRSPVDAKRGALKSWEYLHELTGDAWNGRKTSNPCDDGEMWECPELFPLDGGHVLIYSTLGRVFWESGLLNEATMKFTAMQKGELDWGGFYAPKTQQDAQGRRILWGWIQERNRTQAQMRSAGWSGMMSLPRVLSLDADGRLGMRALPRITSLRHGALRIDSEPGSKAAVLPKANGEVLASGDKGHDFQLRVSVGADEMMSIRYIAASHVLQAGDREIALSAEDQPRVHLYVDGSVVEAILGGRVGYTKRFYYTGAAPEIAVRILGKGALDLQAWKIEPISTNRLTGAA